MNRIILNINRMLTLFICLSVFLLTNVIHADQTTTKIQNLRIELFTGKTMGTTYQIKVVMDNNGLSKEQLANRIEDKLKQVNQSMSVYIKDSEISLFNKAGKGEVIKISPEFYSVIVEAQKLYTMTEGAWDGTVKPLVDLWGFGTKKEITTLPASVTIKAHLQTTGFNQIIIGSPTLKTIEKKNSAISLDLGSIAKGFGVDAVAQLIKNQGFSNFLVEIGGEVFASGEKLVSEKGDDSEGKTDAKSWIVGISRPNKEKSTLKEKLSNNYIYKALPLRNKALATSGDYRNFIIVNGKSYSHIINPATGYPVDNGVVSASVIADNCTFADGLATALMVMGHEKGIELVNSLDNVECLIVVRNGKGILTDFKSKEFPLP